MKLNLAESRPHRALWIYWIAISLFVLLFVFSVVTTLGDLETSYEVYNRLGFANWTVFFNSVAKILGLVAILQNRSRTLKEFAYAGFLFDVLLALVGHILQQEIDVLLAIFGLVIWAFAYFSYRAVYPLAGSLK